MADMLKGDGETQNGCDAELNERNLDKLTNNISMMIDIPADVKTTPEESNEENEEKETVSEAPNIERDMIHSISESPPFQLSIFLGLQQTLVALAANFTVSSKVAEYVCANKDNKVNAELLATTLLMSGVTTILMTYVGTRLPLFQGAAPYYIIPVSIMATAGKGKCDSVQAVGETILHNIQSLQGSLILAGLVHCLVGMTGLVGFLLRFVGPVTIAPTIFLVAIYLMKKAVESAVIHWGVAFLTCAISIIPTLYMSKIKIPVPIWTREKKLHVIQYPLLQVFCVLIAMLTGWIVCGIITGADGIPDNKNHTAFKARTDARNGNFKSTKWFHFPYPGQFGDIGFSSEAFGIFLIATFISILDSVGDYYACASMCRVPPPPTHAVNRGIAVEGFCSVISGFLGCGHATTTYGGNIACIAATKVSSRRVFFVSGVIFLIFGIFSKFAAAFMTIPAPVSGGVLISMSCMYMGVAVSNLKTVDLSSSRNFFIMGTSIFWGLTLPHWVNVYGGVKTEYKLLNDVLKTFLGNPNMFGAILACVLDNTVPGTAEERGMIKEQNVDGIDRSKTSYVEGHDVYDLWLPEKIKHAWFMKYLPFLPNCEEVTIQNAETSEQEQQIDTTSSERCEKSSDKATDDTANVAAQQ